MEKVKSKRFTLFIRNEAVARLLGKLPKGDKSRVVEVALIDFIRSGKLTEVFGYDMDDIGGLTDGSRFGGANVGTGEKDLSYKKKVDIVDKKNIQFE